MVVGIWMMVGAGFGVLCGFGAVERNRTALGWWLAGVATGPLALAALRIMGTRGGPKAVL